MLFFFLEPIITDCGDLAVANASSNSITLNISSLQVSYASTICVSSLDAYFETPQCNAASNHVVILGKLTSATEYNFTINAAISSNEHLLFSSKSCSIRAATCEYYDENQ
jgi:hypothetical protein